jgi:FMN-dependent dehydrogenase
VRGLPSWRKRLSVNIQKCQNHHDFRLEALRRLPRPIFDYIDGGSDDEVSIRRNAESFADCDLVPNVLAGVGEIDLSVKVMGQELALPVYCSPVALQAFPPRGRAGCCCRLFKIWNNVRRLVARHNQS